MDIGNRMQAAFETGFARLSRMGLSSRNLKRHARELGRFLEWAASLEDEGVFEHPWRFVEPYLAHLENSGGGHSFSRLALFRALSPLGIDGSGEGLPDFDAWVAELLLLDTKPDTVSQCFHAEEALAFASVLSALVTGRMPGVLRTWQIGMLTSTSSGPEGCVQVHNDLDSRGDTVIPAIFWRLIVLNKELPILSGHSRLSTMSPETYVFANPLRRFSIPSSRHIRMLQAAGRTTLNTARPEVLQEGFLRYLGLPEWLIKIKCFGKSPAWADGTILALAPSVMGAAWEATRQRLVSAQ